MKLYSCLLGTLALSAAVAGVACGGSSYGSSGRATLVVPVRTASTDVNDADHNPAAFSARAHQRMDHITEQAYQRVHDGRVAPTVLDELQNRRATIEQRITEYGADGIIGDHERRNVSELLEGMSHTLDRYEVRGGGPRYIGP